MGCSFCWMQLCRGMGRGGEESVIDLTLDQYKYHLKTKRDFIITKVVVAD